MPPMMHVKEADILLSYHSRGFTYLRREYIERMFRITHEPLILILRRPLVRATSSGSRVEPDASLFIGPLASEMHRFSLAEL